MTVEQFNADDEFSPVMIGHPQILIIDDKELKFIVVDAGERVSRYYIKLSTPDVIFARAPENAFELFVDRSADNNLWMRSLLVLKLVRLNQNYASKVGDLPSLDDWLADHGLIDNLMVNGRYNDSIDQVAGNIINVHKSAGIRHIPVYNGRLVKLV